METELLNFHDEENFSNSLYDERELSGVDANSSLLEMLHSDLQYSSDYHNQSEAPWDSEQEQELNGDIAVLPGGHLIRCASECSSTSSKEEDFHKLLFDWNEHVLTFQSPLDPDEVDLRIDSNHVPSELPENIFDDTADSNNSRANSSNNFRTHTKSSTPLRSSTPNCIFTSESPPKNIAAANLNEDVSVSQPSLELDMSISGLDLTVSDIDMSALDINVSALDANTIVSELFTDKSHNNQNIESNSFLAVKEIIEPINNKLVIEENSIEKNTALNGVACDINTQTEKRSETVNVKPDPDAPILDDLGKADVEQLHALALEFIKEQEEHVDIKSEPDIDVDIETIAEHIPVLEAGNVESLLEQFEASEAVNPAPSFPQSMPGSPIHRMPTRLPASMPTTPISTAPNSPSWKADSQSSTKSLALVSPKKPNRSSLLHQNIKDALPVEVLNRIKASAQKKSIRVIPAMPSKAAGKLGTRMQDAGVTLSRNKLLKIVSPKGSSGESVQLDHDYCTNDIPRPFYNSNLSEYSQQTKRVQKTSDEWDDASSSRKDSGLESGEVSDESESALPSGGSSGCETGSSGIGITINKAGGRSFKTKVQIPGQPGRNKEMLMVSVLKKVNCDAKKVNPQSNAKVVASPNPNSLLKPISTNTAPATPAIQPKEEERPKKRKLNLEEYRNRLKTLQREKYKTATKGESDNKCEVVEKPEPSSPKVGLGNKCEVVAKTAPSSPIVVGSDDKCEVVVKTEPNSPKNQEVEAETVYLEQPEDSSKPTAPSINADTQPQPEDENVVKRKEGKRQYRKRNCSSSSSEDSVSPSRERKGDRRRSSRKSIWSRSSTRSRASSNASSRSRSSSSSSSRSRSRSSGSSSSSCSRSSLSDRSSRYGSRSRSRRKYGRRKSRSSSRNRRSSWRRREDRSCSRYRREPRRDRKRSRSSRSSARNSFSWRYRRVSPRARSRQRNISKSSTSSRSRKRSRSCSRSKPRSWRESNSRSKSFRSSRSRSRSRSVFSGRSRKGRSSGDCNSRRFSDRSSPRSRSPVGRNSRMPFPVDWGKLEQEQNRRIEERRVIYVGRIPQDTTKAELRRRFEVFGPVVDINLHFREHADNYGFVTFAYKVDAYEAVEHGNDDRSLPRYDLCFGGRRKFCRERYADLDGMACVGPGDFISRTTAIRPGQENSFDDMLREAQARMRERRKV